MDIGKPRRVHRVEPIRTPVPAKTEPEKVTPPDLPVKAPAT
jgi:hypothetical protein